jgi:hypothetical protein
MGENALVILGAGASRDIIPPVPNQARIEEEYQSPVTAELFGEGRAIRERIEKYEGVLQLASNLTIRLRSQTLESILAEFSKSREPRRQAQFRQIPLYLQDLFWDISWRYTNEAINYTHLIDELFEVFDHVTFLTLNYDLFMERALGIATLSKVLAPLGSYVSSKWLLVKLHGSASWGRKLLEYTAVDRNREGSHDAYLEVIATARLNENLGEIQLLAPANRWIRTQPLYYPALTVPVDGKYEYNCPRAHLEALKDRLPDCSHVLAIGVSGKDQDLLDLMNQRLPNVVRQFVLVNNGADATSEAATNFSRAAPQLGAVSLRDAGFSDFLLTGGLTQFCRSALP